MDSRLFIDTQARFDLTRAALIESIQEAKRAEIPRPGASILAHFARRIFDLVVYGAL